MNRLLEGKTAFITGATRGIGKEIALLFAQQGAQLALIGTKEDLLEDVHKQVTNGGTKCLTHTVDVTDEAAVQKAVRRTADHFGTIDILVSNAGVNSRKSTLDLSTDDWNRMLDINLNGAFHVIRAVLPEMIEAGKGRVITISSSTAKSGHRNASPAYGASKAAVDYLVRHLALEMAPHQITVNGLSPGPVETDMVSQWTDDYRRQVLANVPLGRLGKPEEIAGAALFLASDLCPFITGETININGGTYMN